MSFRFHDELAQVIDQRIAQLSDDVGRGLASDFADYKHRCGVIAGLREALDHADAVKTKLIGA